MSGSIGKVLGLFMLSMAVSAMVTQPAQATSITTTVTGVVTRVGFSNPFGLSAVGDRIFAKVTYEDLLISPVGSSILSVETDPSFAFSVKIGPSFLLDLPDFSTGNHIGNRSPELTFQDGDLSGISFRWRRPSDGPFFGFGVSSRSDSSFQHDFVSSESIGVGEFAFYFEGDWDFSTAGGGPSGNAPIPEPATFLLFGSGVAGLIVWRWNKSRISELR